jgi:tRNA pseudouridine38-40 synthase
MAHWRLDLAWDGTRFVGWQRQSNGLSIQQVVEEALLRLLGGEKVRVDAAGRTDAGVHALQQVASFSCRKERSSGDLLRGLNGLLPADIACLKVTEAPMGFHARYWTLKKKYRYRFLHSRVPCPFRTKRCWRRGEPLDLVAMSEAAKHFAGTHDFQGFRSSGCSARTTVRSIESSLLQESGDELHFDVIGNGFLRHQVRIMSGTLLAVGQGRLLADEVPKLILGQDRKLAGQTAPAHGLWLLWTEVAKSAPKP